MPPTFDSIVNFRDFGGYAAGPSVRVRKGVLFRSATLDAATSADVEKLAALKVSVVVDLRRPSERPERARVHAHGLGARIVVSDLGGAIEDPWHDHLAASDLTVASMREYLTGFYRGGLLDTRHVEVLSRAFAALPALDGAMLVHCAAGKDRTGMLVALTQHLLGVARADIIHEYLLTNAQRRFEDHGAEVAAALGKWTARAPSDDFVRAAMTLEPAYLEAAFAGAEQAYGTLDAYLEQALGVDSRMRGEIRARCLE